MILSHLLKKFQIIRIFKLQRQRLNVLVIQIGVNEGYVNQWKVRLKVCVAWTQMKFLITILKVIISFIIRFIISFTTEADNRVVLWKKSVLWNVAKLTGKHLCQSLFFNNVAGVRHRCFPVNFAKFLRTIFLQKTSGRLLLSGLIKGMSSTERNGLFWK